MKRAKRARREDIAAVIEQLTGEEVLEVENSAVVANALQRYRSTNADFADCLFAESARAAGCEKTLTFDETAVRDLGMELIQ